MAQLATQATTGVARIAEGVHQAVWSMLSVPGGKTPGTTRGITGLVYKGIACYTVAATMAAKRSLLADRLVGDGLVPLHSALGQHLDPRRSLVFAKGSQWIGHRRNHLDLLHHPDVTRQLLQWLAPVAPGSPSGP